MKNFSAKIIFLIVIALIILTPVVAFLILFNPKVEKVTIHLSKETIYLKQLSTINDDVSVISRKFFTVGVPDTLDEYVANRSQFFFYKVKNDSLFIYGSDTWSIPKKKLINHIKFFDIGDSIVIYMYNYKKLNLELFPPSKEKGFANFYR